MKVHSFFALVCSLCLLSSAHGAVTINTTTNVAPAGGAVHDPYDPSTTGSPLLTASDIDIAQGLTKAGGGISSTGSDTIESSAGLDVTTDGSLATVYGEDGSGGDVVDHAGYATVGTNDLITYNLGGEYDLTQVDVFAGWNDSGRDEFSFDLNVSEDGTSFTTIATYNKGADNTGDITVPVTNLHSIVDDNPVPLDIATGVRFVQLAILDADNGYAGLAELDVFGTQVNIPGNANNDSVVDILDFFVISDNFFSVPSEVGADGDVNFDNFVDQKDFRFWRNIVGETVAATVAVPEPTSVMLLGICTLMGFGARRRRV